MSHLTNQLREMDRAMLAAGLDREALLRKVAFRLEGVHVAPRSPQTVGSPGANDAQARLSAPFARRIVLTLAPTEVARILHIDEDEVASLIDTGQMQAVKIGGRWHVPEWQMHAASQSGLLPGLDRLLEAARGRLDWIQLAFFMLTPQPELVASAPLNIVEWLHLKNPLEPALRIVRKEAL